MFSDYIRDLRSKGHVLFTLDEASNDLGVSHNVIACAVSRLKKKGAVMSPAKGLYIIVPPEHQREGSIPAEELVPILMQYWGIEYYVGLLTAAMYHGASHQKPQQFQIITNKQIKRDLTFGSIHIDCVCKKNWDLIDQLNVRVVKTGFLKLSSPEQTVMDLLLYPSQSGGLSHIATVLSELMDGVSSDKLLILAKKSKEKYWIQRLGFILEKIDLDDFEKKEKILRLLCDHLESAKTRFIPLETEMSIIGAVRSERWKIIENVTIERDL